MAEDSVFTLDQTIAIKNLLRSELNKTKYQVMAHIDEKVDELRKERDEIIGEKIDQAIGKKVDKVIDERVDKAVFKKNEEVINTAYKALEAVNEVKTISVDLEAGYADLEERYANLETQFNLSQDATNKLRNDIETVHNYTQEYYGQILEVIYKMETALQQKIEALDKSNKEIRETLEKLKESDARIFKNIEKETKLDGTIVKELEELRAEKKELSYAVTTNATNIGSVTSKVDQINETVKIQTETVNRMSEIDKKHTREFEKAKKLLNELGEKDADFENRIEKNKQGIEGANTRMTAIDEKHDKAYLEAKAQLEALEQQSVNFDARIVENKTSIDGAVADLQEAKSTLVKRDSALKGFIDENTTKIENANTSMANTVKTLKELETKDNKLQKAVTELRGFIDKNISNIDGIDKKLKNKLADLYKWCAELDSSLKDKLPKKRLNNAIKTVIAKVRKELNLAVADLEKQIKTIDTSSADGVNLNIEDFKKKVTARIEEIEKMIRAMSYGHNNPEDERAY